MEILDEINELIEEGNTILEQLNSLIDCQESAVAFVTPSSSMGKNDAPKDVLVKLYTADEAPLAQAVTVDVEDGGGTAEPGVHYSFSPSSVTFPVNSPNGDTETVTVTPIANAITDVKTAVLKLNPGKVGTVAKHEVGITACQEWCYLLPLDDWFETSTAETAYYSCGTTNPSPELATGTLITYNGRPAWQSKQRSGSQLNTYLARKLILEVPSETTVTEVRVFYTFTAGGGNSDAWYKRVELNGQPLCHTSFPPPVFTFLAQDISGESLELYISFYLNNYNGNLLSVTDIQLVGTGVPLFGICDNCP